jgi:hypothetical protein
MSIQDFDHGDLKEAMLMNEGVVVALHNVTDGY